MMDIDYTRHSSFYFFVHSRTIRELKKSQMHIFRYTHTTSPKLWISLPPFRRAGEHENTVNVILALLGRSSHSMFNFPQLIKKYVAAICSEGLFISRKVCRTRLLEREGQEGIGHPLTLPFKKSQIQLLQAQSFKHLGTLK